MGLILGLNRVFNLAKGLFILVVGLIVACIFALMPLAMIFKGTGSPAYQRLIHSDGFFAWPVATEFALMELAPWFIGIGLAGAVVGAILKRLVFRDSDTATAEVLAISQTGTTVNSRPQMRMRLNLAGREVEVRGLVDLGAVPRPGDRVRLRVSRADPSLIRYAGLA